jgi:hypothetical protein
MWNTRNIYFFFINWTLRMSDNFPERIQILCHAQIICITVLENRIICCQIFCDLLLKYAFERIFNVIQLILVKIKWHIKWKYLIQKFHDICLSYYFNVYMYYWNLFLKSMWLIDFSHWQTLWCRNFSWNGRNIIAGIKHVLNTTLDNKKGEHRIHVRTDIEIRHHIHWTEYVMYWVICFYMMTFPWYRVKYAWLTYMIFVLEQFCFDNRYVKEWSKYIIQWCWNI